MKRFLFVISIIVSAILSGVLLDTSSANAQSAYDNAYKTIDTTKVTGRGGTDTFFDSPTGYIEAINGIFEPSLTGPTVVYDYSTTTSNGGTGSQAQLDIANEWQNALDNGRWSVSVAKAPNGVGNSWGNYAVMVYYSLGNELSLGWNTNAVYASKASSNSYRIKIYYNSASDSYRIERRGIASDESGQPVFKRCSSAYGAESCISWSGTDDYTESIWNFVTYVDEGNINYPVGYEGEPIRETFNPSPHVLPRYQWSVDTKGVLRLSYTKNLDPRPMGEGSVNLFGFETEFMSGTPLHVQNEVDDQGWLDIQVIDVFQDLNYTFETLPSAGFYTVRVEYLGDYPDDLIVRSVTFNIRWDGKSFISGTNDDDCDVGEDTVTSCSTETEKNPFVSALTSVDVPIYGLQSVVIAPLGFITSLLSHSQVCTPLSLPLDLYEGGTHNLSIPCMESVYRQHLGNVLIDFYQTILLALTSYYIFIRILASLKNANDPRTNSIEVAKL